MTGISFLQRSGFLRFCATLAITICTVGSFAVQPALAATERALYLYYTHTKETARIVFKRDGQYVQSGLNELNQFLRDWRRNEPTKMDPRLFDLVWEVYQEVGGTQPINIVSAYRSPKTNAMLAQNSSGVADNSQHMRGTAMDFFIPGVPLAKLRAVAMRKQVGGVGYYPTSGSPFVHLDVGSVRAWPRMTRAQLKEIFPDGRTMHLPNDGKPLSQEGYNIAMAEWKRCHAYPCNGGGSSGTMVADSGGSSGKTLMDVLFGGKQNTPSTPAAPSAPAPAPVQVAAVEPQVSTPSVAPVPAQRPANMAVASVAPSQQPASAPVPAEPAFLPFSTVGSAPLNDAELTTAVVAPVPAMKSETLRVATAAALPAGDAVTALAALTDAPRPMPPLHTSEPNTTLTAYAAAPAGLGRPVIASLGPTVTGSIPAPAATDRSVLASVGTPMPTELTALPPSETEMASLFSNTFTAAESAQQTNLVAALSRHVAKPAATGMRSPSLVAPDFEHVTDVFAAPASLSSDHFAVIFDRDEADFDPTPEMGSHVIVMGAGDDTTMGHGARFTPVSN